MTDSMDEELRRAIKASTDRSLKGWEFTPAMQRRVLERIQAEESGTASTPAKMQRRFSPQVLRPVAWTAVAAAALLMVTNSGLVSFRMGSSREQSTAQSTAESGASAKMAGAPADAEPGQAEMAGAAAGAGTGATGAGVPGQPGVTGSAGEERQALAARVNEAAVPGQNTGDNGAVALLAAPGSETGGQPGGTDGAQPGGPTGTEAGTPPGSTTSPGESAIATLPGDQAPGLLAPGRLVALQVPAMARGKGAHTDEPLVMGLMAMPLTEEVRQVAAPGNRLVELSSAGVRLLDAGGTIVWERPLEGASGDGRLAVSANGRIAAGAGSQLYILSSLGEVEERLSLAALPVELLWAGDGYLAVAEPHQVGVYREGSNLWTVPLQTDGMVALERASLLVAWGGEQATALTLTDGHQVWRAVPNAPGTAMLKAVASPEGARVALLASVDGGWALWVLDAQGTVLLAEGLPEEPLILFEGDQVRLEMPSSVEVRQIAP